MKIIKIMDKNIWAITKVNLKTIDTAYWIAGITASVSIIQAIVFFILAANGVNFGSNETISSGDALWLVPLFAGIFIPASNFKKIVNLGGKRNNFIWGSLVCYVILAAVISLLNIIIYYTFDNIVIGSIENYGVMNLIGVFGWIESGVVITFFQQLAFLFLLATFTHTLTATQDKWYGWCIDIIIVAIIAVFASIAPLRETLAWFFSLILFSAPYLQIPACLILGGAIYLLNKPIFARKII